MRDMDTLEHRFMSSHVNSEDLGVITPAEQQLTWIPCSDYRLLQLEDRSGTAARIEGYIAGTCTPVEDLGRFVTRTEVRLARIS